MDNFFLPKQHFYPFDSKKVNYAEYTGFHFPYLKGYQPKDFAQNQLNFFTSKKYIMSMRASPNWLWKSPLLVENKSAFQTTL